MTITIRSFEHSDLEQIKEITVEAFNGVSIDLNIENLFGMINGHDWKWRKAQHLEKDAARESEGIFVAVVDEKVVGYISTWHDMEAGIGNIPNLAVSAEFRGGGIGRKLIDHALARFRSLGLKAARIETLDQNEVGCKLYPSYGFREVARQIHFCKLLEE